MELARTLLQALLAVLATAVLVAVPPAALLYLASSQEMLDTVASVALWSGWTLLVSGLVVEIAEAVASRLGRTTPLPSVGGPLRSIARWLVASLVAVGSAFALLPTPAGARQALPSGDDPLALPAAYLPADDDASAGDDGVPADEPTSDIPVDYGETADGGTLEAAATADAPLAGDGTAADGAADGMADDGSQPLEVTVELGDNFWTLAERELTDNWGRIPTDAEVAPYWQGYIDDNADRLLPPQHPDLLYPDQVLVPPPVPADPTAAPGADDAVEEADVGASDDGASELDEEPAASTDAAGAPGGSPADDLPEEPSDTELGEEPAAKIDEPPADDPFEEPTEEPAASTDQPPAETEGDEQPADTAPFGSATGPKSADAGEGGVASSNAASVSDADDQSDESNGSSFPSTLIPVGALGLGGVLLLVHRRRRVQQRHRQHGARLAPPELELQQTEEELVDAADEDAALRLDATLRAAAAGAGVNGLPPLRWVETGPQASMLIFESLAPAPEGFKLKTRNSWLATGTIEDMEARGEATAPPAPTLLPIGATSPDSEALIELEASGVLTLEGPEEETLDLLRALALSAASSPWSQRTQVVLVGIGGEMTELPWVSQASLEGALDRAEAHVGQVSAALEPLGCETTTQARARVPQSEAWDPLVIVSAVRPDDAGIRLRLRELIAQPRRGVSVVTLAPRNAVLPARSLVIEDDGSMRADGIDQVVWPRLLDEANSEGMVQLLGQAGQLGDEAFTLASSSTTGDGPPDDSPPDSGPAPADSSPAAAPVEPSGPSRLGLEVVLDDVEVLVRVLGEVVAVRRPGLPSEEKLIPSRHKVLETATYLAARQQPVAAGELERSLFPNDRDPAARVTASVDAARSLLGDDLVLGPTDGAYEVSDRVTTDYGLFAELTAQADETDDAHRAAWLLTEALDLVRGEPFTGVGQGYAWVAAHREVIISEVVDAAEELAEVRLALGDWRSAEWAARQGLRAFPTDERLYRLLMRVAQAAGRGTSGVRDLVDQLQEAMRDPKRGVAGEDSLHPETIELMQELTGAGLEPAGADAWQEA